MKFGLVLFNKMQMVVSANLKHNCIKQHSPEIIGAVSSKKMFPLSYFKITKIIGLSATLVAFGFLSDNDLKFIRTLWPCKKRSIENI